MTFTMPEGVPTYSPPPAILDPRPPDRVSSIGSASFMATVALILGVVISTGTIIGFVGKAFYVERSEYNVAVVRTAEERIAVTETLKQVREAMSRQETTLQKLTDDLATVREDLAAIRGKR
jgi:hypothetical protein